MFSTCTVIFPFIQYLDNLVHLPQNNYLKTNVTSSLFLIFGTSLLCSS